LLSIVGDAAAMSAGLCAGRRGGGPARPAGPSPGAARSWRARRPGGDPHRCAGRPAGGGHSSVARGAGRQFDCQTCGV